MAVHVLSDDEARWIIASERDGTRRDAGSFARPEARASIKDAVFEDDDRLAQAALDDRRSQLLDGSLVQRREHVGERMRLHATPDGD